MRSEIDTAGIDYDAGLREWEPAEEVPWHILPRSGRLAATTLVQIALVGLLISAAFGLTVVWAGLAVVNGARTLDAVIRTAGREVEADLRS